MVQITGGKVTFERSVKPADYENKKAVVELSYTLEEGVTLEGAEALLAQVAQQAQDRVLALVGLKQATTSNVVPIKKATAKPAKAEAIEKPIEPIVEAADPFTTGTAQPSEPSTASPPLSPPTSTATAESELAEALGEKPAPLPPVTDADIRDNVARWMNVHKNSKRILELRLLFAGTPPKTLMDIPQERRHEFLAALHKESAA